MTEFPKPTRPLLRWHGGKWRMHEFIIGFMPPHEVYIEPFGGACSVLMCKPPVKIEVYNDRDKCLVNFMRVLRDPVMSPELRRRLELTPFARSEFEDCWDDLPEGVEWEVSDDPVEDARRLVVRSFQAIGAKSSLKRNGWRTRTAKAQWSPCVAWNGWPDEIPVFTGRLKDTIIENLRWQKVVETYDHKDALVYFDPPYLWDSRSVDHRNVYEHEMTDEDHDELLDAANSMKGMALISGYPHPRYERALKGWARHEKKARAQTNAPRIEVLWVNPEAQSRLQPLLFG